MRRESRWAALLGAALAVAGPARGQAGGGEQGTAGGAPQTVAAEVRDEGRRGLVAAEVGLSTYAGEAARLTSPGVTYGISAGLELGSGVSAEFGYTGSNYGLEGSELTVAENGGRLLAKVGPVYGRLSPYGLWGLEVTRLNVVGAGEAGGVQDATMVRLPLGAGLDWALPSQGDTEISLGLRAQYLFTLDAGAFPGLGEPNAANQFVTTASLGAIF